MNNNLSEEVVFIISATSWLSREILPFLNFSFKKFPQMEVLPPPEAAAGQDHKKEQPEKSGAVRPVEYQLNQ